MTTAMAILLWGEAYPVLRDQQDWDLVLDGGYRRPFPAAGGHGILPVHLNLSTSPPPPGQAISGAGYSRGGRDAGGGWLARRVRAVFPGPAGPGPGQPPSPSYPPFSNRGMHGFNDMPGPAPEPELPDVMGALRGYRWWTLAAPDLSGNPADADETWPFSPLKGMRDTWGDGENIAKCLAGPRYHEDREIPHRNCSCGFWAYWRLQAHDTGYRGLPVCGVVEGYGATMIGSLGFRAARARIVALHLPFTIAPSGDPGEGIPGLGLPARRDASQVQPNGPAYRPGRGGTVYHRGNPWHNHPLFHGKVYDYRDQEPQPVPELSGPSAEGRQADRDRSEAWMAVIGDRLAQMYPSATVFETRAAMEAQYPPDLSYVPDAGACRCANAARFAWVSPDGHKYGCPLY